MARKIMSSKSYSPFSFRVVWYCSSTSASASMRRASSSPARAKWLLASFTSHWFFQAVRGLVEPSSAAWVSAVSSSFAASWASPILCASSCCVVPVLDCNAPRTACHSGSATVSLLGIRAACGASSSPMACFVWAITPTFSCAICRRALGLSNPLLTSLMVLTRSPTWCRVCLMGLR